MGPVTWYVWYRCGPVGGRGERSALAKRVCLQSASRLNKTSRILLQEVDHKVGNSGLAVVFVCNFNRLTLGFRWLPWVQIPAFQFKYKVEYKLVFWVRILGLWRTILSYYFYKANWYQIIVTRYQRAEKLASLNGELFSKALKEFFVATRTEGLYRSLTVPRKVVSHHHIRFKLIYYTLMVYKCSQEWSKRTSFKG